MAVFVKVAMPNAHAFDKAGFVDKLAWEKSQLNTNYAQGQKPWSSIFVCILSMQTEKSWIQENRLLVRCFFSYYNFGGITILKKPSPATKNMYVTSSGGNVGGFKRDLSLMV